MTPRSFFWKTFTYFLGLILVSSVLFGLFLYRRVHQFNVRTLQENLRKQTMLLSGVIEKSDEILADPKIVTSSVHTDDRITIMALDGTVLADNWVERIGKEAVENHFDRPEFQAALKDSPIFVTRLSETVQTEMLYYALPVQKEGKTILILRLSFPLTEVIEQGRMLRNFILGAAVIAILISAPLIFGLSKHFTKPVEIVRDHTKKIASGDLTQRVPVIGPSEVQELAKEFNYMAGELQQKISTIQEEHQRLETLLSRMVEGVLAIDRNGRAVFANRAFCRLTGTTMDQIQRRSFLEIARNHELSNFISELLQGKVSEGPKEISFIRAGEEIIFSIQASRIYDNKQTLSLILLVFHDITQMRRLEKMRKDFVANVSHELRTPLTAIHGATEVLLDGAYKDPEQSRRFLQIMEKQLGNMQDLVNDMLKLAAVEEGSLPHRREETDTVLLVEDVVTVIRPLARKKNQIMEVQLDSNLPRIHVDPHQITDALMNILDNAVKYTPENGKIELKAFIEQDNLVFSVSDNGPGIPKEQLPRIFERFYRVDKSRSREMGGTGLGLSIAKHAIENHGGSISVECPIGMGTTFIIKLPLT